MNTMNSNRADEPNNCLPWRALLSNNNNVIQLHFSFNPNHVSLLFILLVVISNWFFLDHLLLHRFMITTFVCRVKHRIITKQNIELVVVLWKCEYNYNQVNNSSAKIHYFYKLFPNSKIWWHTIGVITKALHVAG